MSRSTSVLTELLQLLPQWRSQMYFKVSLTALSHAMEDQVLAEDDQPLVIASFQRERFYRQEAHRYRRIAHKSGQVYVLSAPETDFKHSSDVYETIAFQPDDSLAQEWHLVVISRHYASCLICRERTHLVAEGENRAAMDNNRRFEGIWTSDRHVSQQAAQILLNHILDYRPELAEKIRCAQEEYLICELTDRDHQEEPDPFVQRLVTYLQAGQYKLLKANRSLASKEHKERLINSVMAAIRRSLDPEDILQVAVQKLGQGLGVCRCVVYRCKEADINATIEHEFLNSGISSIKGQKWPLKNNPLFQEALELRESLKIEDAIHDPRLPGDSIQNLVRECSIYSWLLVPIFYQSRLLGMLELHHCGPYTTTWKSEDVALVDAVATQIGVALIQAEAYANLQDLNEQLAALDRTRSNLVAITGHELRTPLSTIQVCLESLASEPDMPAEMRQIMLDTALKDAERMRKLIQDFLTLSRLESGRVNWNPEALSLSECVELAISHVHSCNLDNENPKIINLVPPNLPFVLADGEWLVELLSKLLDNACKFTGREGNVSIEVASGKPKTLEVTISDTGRGIEPNRLEQVFDRFYQEEGALRRSAGGTGLGLAICRQIVNGWGGEIWAESRGKNHGSQFHFTIPIFKDKTNDNPKNTAPKKSSRRPASKRK
ncbi:MULTISPECIES: DICT sensory domain-containing protein [Microcystis]|jgi:DICT domain-containing protein/signal transduction histidine kinase|uniref:histidine kinase n=2 Tax=Microcystis TaxID=1125 RepID=A0A0A1VUK7_MICAE|nr:MULTISPECIES: DICT sensory domain-containing protein [Microcystis]MDT3676384.1 DICT sensory domain-containing protein [Microcystis wesenbergii NRERC-220]GAL93497.1 sensory transduction histidine kinase [Microcystis aeruginosa NIES-44]